MEITLGESIIRLLLSCILGGLIGLEREKTNRPAGLRTHIIVSLSSCLVMLVSYHMAYEFGGVTNLDPGRMGSYVISGIGFLGAGTIIREGATVKGLTTAASLWGIACLGLAVGAGMYEISILVTALIFLILLVMNKIEHRYVKKRQYVFNPKSEEDYYQVLNKILEEHNLEVSVKKSNKDGEEVVTYDIIEIDKKNDLD